MQMLPSIPPATIPAPEALRPHDLLWAEVIVFSKPEGLPAWLSAASPDCTRRAPLVVRRAPPTFVDENRLVPVGIRGQSREQRYAAHTQYIDIRRVATPEALLTLIPQSAACSDYACMRALSMFLPLLNDTGLIWGPTGGVGFTLASNLPVLHTDSDLDLLIRLPAPPDAAQQRMLRRLSDRLSEAPCRIDIQIDNGRGGFALSEWLGSSTQQIMLKTADGPFLVSDPWHLPANARAAVAPEAVI